MDVAHVSILALSVCISSILKYYTTTTTTTIGLRFFQRGWQKNFTGDKLQYVNTMDMCKMDAPPPCLSLTSSQRCWDVALARRPCWRRERADDTSFMSSNWNLAAITHRAGREEQIHTLKKKCKHAAALLQLTCCLFNWADLSDTYTAASH